MLFDVLTVLTAADFYGFYAARGAGDILLVCFQMHFDDRVGSVARKLVPWGRYLTDDQEEFLEELLATLQLDEDCVDSPAPGERIGVTFYVTTRTKAVLNRMGRDAGLRGAGPLARLLVLSWLNAREFPRPRRRRIPGKLR